MTALPKVALHEHLDGGLRPGTLLELAAETGYDGMGSEDLAALRNVMFQGDSGSLERYLAAFEHTIAVMQTPDAIHRVALEAVEDLAADGVAYAEIRFAPMLHTQRGLSPAEVLDIVLVGLRDGEGTTGMPSRVIVDSLRQDPYSEAMAELAAEYVGRGVVGFDLAGPEAGNPAADHAAACQAASAAGLHITIHAGEGDGVESIRSALDDCHAERLGHGVRIVEDTTIEGGEIVELGPIAKRVHDEQIALEVAISSNVHTGIYSSVAEHPAGLLHRAGFVVTLNTDNRLMSDTSLSREFELASAELGFTLSDLRTVTANAIEAAFCGPELKDRLKASLAAYAV